MGDPPNFSTYDKVIKAILTQVGINTLGGIMNNEEAGRAGQHMISTAGCGSMTHMDIPNYQHT